MSTLRVILSGGLGNQLFQYATARALAERTGAELVLDTISGFKDDHVYQRFYELDVFPGPKSCAKTDEPSSKAWLWFRMRQRMRPRFMASGLGILDEVLHQHRILELPTWEGTRLLMGFWQEERYFQDIRDVLRRELFGTGPLEKQSGTKVAMHVRRVQYTRGVGEEYFLDAMRDCREAIPGVTFHLFTDDPEWGASFAEAHEDVVCQSQPGATAIDDFSQLLSFKHFIIANSTFSWWAAWLGSETDSRVICPPASAWSNPLTPAAAFMTPEEPAL